MRFYWFFRVIYELNWEILILYEDRIRLFLGVIFTVLYIKNGPRGPRQKLHCPLCQLYVDIMIFCRKNTHFSGYFWHLRLSGWTNFFFLVCKRKLRTSSFRIYPSKNSQSNMVCIWWVIMYHLSRIFKNKGKVPITRVWSALKYFFPKI